METNEVPTYLREIWEDKLHNGKSHLDHLYRIHRGQCYVGQRAIREQRDSNAEFEAVLLWLKNVAKLQKRNPKETRTELTSHVEINTKQT